MPIFGFLVSGIIIGLILTSKSAIDPNSVNFSIITVTPQTITLHGGSLAGSAVWYGGYRSKYQDGLLTVSVLGKPIKLPGSKSDPFTITIPNKYGDVRMIELSGGKDNFKIIWRSPPINPISPPNSNDIKANGAVTQGAIRLPANKTGSQTPTQTIPDPTIPNSQTSPPKNEENFPKNDPETWPRYIFKELGFSIKLPFSVIAENWRPNYVECLEGSAYDFNHNKIEAFCDNDQHYFSYFANGDNSFGDHFSLGSITKLYTYGRDWTPPTIYNFHSISGGNFAYGDPGESGLIIHPLKTLRIQDRLVLIFDEIKDFYGKDERNPFSKENAVYGIAIQLDGNKIFKAAVIELFSKNSNGSLIIAEEVANSIHFLTN